MALVKEYEEMTKQGEIIRTPEQKEAHKVYLASLRRQKIKDETNKLMDRCWTKGSYPGQMVFQAQKFLNELLPLLDRLDVVIRVDENKLPTIDYHSAYPENEERYQQAMLDAGYVAVESLVEQE